MIKELLSLRIHTKKGFDPTPWEPAPLLLRWKGKERRRACRSFYLLFIYHDGYTVGWDYR